MEKNVFSLKMTVVCLTAYLSLPKNHLTTVNSKLNFQAKSWGWRRVSEPASRENFYPLKLPTELYQALVDRMSKTKLSKGDCLIDMLTETAFREGFLPEEHYKFLKEKYGTKTLLEKVLENRAKTEGSSITFEVSSAKMEIQKGSGRPQRSIDYSKLSNDELLRRYQQAILSNDVVAVNVIQGVAHSRGFKFKVDDVGNVQVVGVS
jgi:hypothetical protein